MSKWTTQDMLDGLCDLTQVGQERPEEEVREEKGGTFGTIEDYLAIHEELGGREFLLAWARANPAKFYDQLLKILEKMDTIKRAGENVVTLERLSGKEIGEMSSSDLKRILLESAGG